MWGDIDFDRSRIVVRSPKTERHEGKAQRTIPLFPELLPYLEAARNEFLEDFDPKVNQLSEQPVITRYRQRNCNLRTQLERIITKAGVPPWPKLFQNLRASRATELAKEHPGHVAAAWLGHSVAVADKHYWQITDDDFANAVQKVGQQLTATEGTDGNERHSQNEPIENTADIPPTAVPSSLLYTCLDTPVGAEHPSESSGKSDVASSGAAESAAVDPELAIVIDAWERLAPDLRSAIIRIVRKTVADGGTYDEC